MEAALVPRARTDMAKLKVAFRYYSKAPRKSFIINIII